MRTKLAIKSENMTSFGGIFHVMDVFEGVGLPELINSTLGERGNGRALYSYSDLIMSLFCIYLCGGDHIEDITSYLGGTFSMRPNTKAASSDTIARALKGLAQDDVIYRSDSGASYAFNTAERLNRLLLSMLFRLGLLEKGGVLDLDFDHQFTPTGKHDAKYSYKRACGYFPGILSFGGLLLGIENRDGNTNVRFHQEDTLKRFFERLVKDFGMVINRFRADCGSFSENIVRTVYGYCNTFYIRAVNCESHRREFESRREWKSVEINFERCEVASFPFTAFMEDAHFRLVVQRTEVDGRDVDIAFPDKFYTYRCIVTNDWESTEEEIIRYYNGRGESEKNFDIQNNDFGWAHQPFSFLKENTVFLLLTAMLKKFYVFLLGRIHKAMPNVKPNFRLKRFLISFVIVPAKWIRTGRRPVLNLYTKRDYVSVFSSV
jgi:hypothetical protein